MVADDCRIVLVYGRRVQVEKLHTNATGLGACRGQERLMRHCYNADADATGPFLVHGVQPSDSKLMSAGMKIPRSHLSHNKAGCHSHRNGEDGTGQIRSRVQLGAGGRSARVGKRFKGREGVQGLGRGGRVGKGCKDLEGGQGSERGARKVNGCNDREGVQE